MKKSLLLVLAVLFGVLTPISAQSSADDYVPLVKEGVRWECEIVNRTVPEYVEESHHYPYDIVISGDSTINNINYKKCHYLFRDYNESPCDTTVIALLREDIDSKRVYAIFSYKYNFPIPHVIPEYAFKDTTYFTFDQEILLYDFSDIRNSNQYWGAINNFTATDTVINNSIRKIYINNDTYERPHGLIEGIGNMGHIYIPGDLLFPKPFSNVVPAFPTRYTDPVFLNYYNEKGELVYSSGRKANVENIEVEDNNAPILFYNLQGVKVTNPSNGVYIKVQGKKATKVFVK